MAIYTLYPIKSHKSKLNFTRSTTAALSVAVLLLVAGISFGSNTKANAFRGALNTGFLEAGACATMIPHTQFLSATSGTFTIDASVTSCSQNDENIAVDWLDATSGVTNTCLRYAQQNSGSIALKSAETKGVSITLPLTCAQNTTFHGYIGSNGVLLFQNDFSYYIK